METFVDREASTPVEGRPQLLQGNLPETKRESQGLFPAHSCDAAIFPNCSPIYVLPSSPGTLKISIKTIFATHTEKRNFPSYIKLSPTSPSS